MSLRTASRLFIWALFSLPPAHAQIRMMETGGGTEYISLQAPAAVATSFTWTMPAADGSANQCLATNGAGALQWRSVGGGSAYSLDAVDGSPVNSVYVDAAGRVGIGTTAPSYALTVENSSNALSTVAIQNFNAGASAVANFAVLSDSYAIEMRAYSLAQNGTTVIQSSAPLFDLWNYNSAGRMSFKTGATGNLSIHINTAGDVGVGTTNPSEKLTVLDGGILLESNNANDVMVNSYNASFGGGFIGRRARGTKASPTHPVNGDVITNFLGSNAIAENSFSGLTVSATQTHTASVQGMELNFSTVANGGVVTSKRMTITNGGNVGIGTTGPQSTLEVRGEIRSTSAPGVARLWGKGRPGSARYGTTGVEAGLCTNSTITFGLSFSTTGWGSSEGVCPLGTWVCTAAERGTGVCNTARPDGATDYADCTGAAANVAANAHLGWVADVGGFVSSGFMVTEAGTTNNGLQPCNSLAVWCCN